MSCRFARFAEAYATSGFIAMPIGGSICAWNRWPNYYNYHRDSPAWAMFSSIGNFCSGAALSAVYPITWTAFGYHYWRQQVEEKERNARRSN